jgi:uncharacterized protein (TIGR02145 family)
MKLVQFRYLFLLILAISTLTRCTKEVVPKTPPVAAFSVSPTNGLTTTIFQFDASLSKATAAGDTLLFIRWDWDNDNIWDSGFSRSRKFTHRYYKPGSYTPRMEIRNEAGLSDTIQLSVQVARGYSAPQPHFTISPASGNLRTEFVFDASLTRDDEDSLNTLKFRWDWEGDGIFDTDFSDQTVTKHYYIASSVYNPILEVTDPEGLSATVHKPVSVSTSNTRLVPQFTWSPDRPTTSDTVRLDASSSYDPDNAGNTFTYRWNFTKDEEFDTEYMTSPLVSYQFTIEGDNEVILEIKDQWGLINQAKVKIFIGHSNLKPTAQFLIGTAFGNLTTNFYFDASSSSDREDIIDYLRVRWDFENDGIWDTEYAKAKIVNHLYTTPGTYRIKLEVIDTGGLTDTTSLTVDVSSGTNETGLILDAKNGIFYGTVKLGAQWWMAENLNEPATGKFCYAASTANCTNYGGLYTWTAVMNGSIAEKARGVCPPSWHVPSLSEWQQLIDYYGSDAARKHLELGGDSDFRMLYAGQRSTAGRSEMLNQVTNFWTSTKSLSGENAQAISFQKDQDIFFKLNLSSVYGFSVRCVKD